MVNQNPILISILVFTLPFTSQNFDIFNLQQLVYLAVILEISTMASGVFAGKLCGGKSCSVLVGNVHSIYP